MLCTSICRRLLTYTSHTHIFTTYSGICFPNPTVYLFKTMHTFTCLGNSGYICFLPFNSHAHSIRQYTYNSKLIAEFHMYALLHTCFQFLHILFIIRRKHVFILSPLYVILGAPYTGLPEETLYYMIHTEVECLRVPCICFFIQ